MERSRPPATRPRRFVLSPPRPRRLPRGGGELMAEVGRVRLGLPLLLEFAEVVGLLYVGPPASTSSLCCPPCPCAGQGDRCKTMGPIFGVLQIFGSRLVIAIQFRRSRSNLGGFVKIFGSRLIVDPIQGSCVNVPPAPPRSPWLSSPAAGGDGRLLVAHQLVVAQGCSRHVSHPLQPPPHQTRPRRLSSIGSGRSHAPVPQSAPQPSPAPPFTHLSSSDPRQGLEARDPPPLRGAQAHPRRRACGGRGAAGRVVSVPLLRRVLMASIGSTRCSGGGSSGWCGGMRSDGVSINLFSGIT
ncbi:hypothetical protein SETIT_2G356800v2 [Setaria italica]|uniref:Uncharacterized protein n=2 Tax=Setaria TaxID=4554 RepID=A0A368Q8J4_SETIT|nr:hypothetical protein SETIT_2G356800v2 [Setaria italica]RCV13581.1 hypothetical protein SETIT_2G356800v2 [Setaria italica]TKW35381.1 hypothetical protein SEVIR_2G367800v2 [Setaria viridis]